MARLESLGCTGGGNYTLVANMFVVSRPPPGMLEHALSCPKSRDIFTGYITVASKAYLMELDVVVCAFVK